MAGSSLQVAMSSEVFHGAGAEERLRARAGEARALGADLLLLPELPMDPWMPATRTVRDEDAEPPGGPRHASQARAAEAASIAILGGAIVKDPETGRRHNTALLFDASGSPVATYRKSHLPQEEGYWEADHYEPGDAPPEIIDALGLPIGVQLCSDTNRPSGFQMLAARGAAAVFAPRCTPASSYDKWRLVLRANAVTGAMYVLSTNRSAAEGGLPSGSPSIAIAPDGAVLAENADPLSLVALEDAAVRTARADYPGYLAFASEMYVRGWSRRP